MIHIPYHTPGGKLKAAAALVMITLAVVAVVDLSGFLTPYSLKTGDLLFRHLPLRPASPDIAVIAIEQPDIDFFRDRGLGWPWPRELYAPLVDFCRRAGTRAVIFDLLFTESSIYGREDDEKFAQAMRAAGNVILPFFLSQGSREPHPGTATILQQHSLPINGAPPGFGKEYQAILPPIPPLLAAARGLGNVEGSPDPDGVFRRLPPAVPFQDRWLPLLAFAAFQLFHQPGPWEFQAGALVQGSFRVPLDREGQVLLKFRGPSRSHRRYSAANVIQSEVRCLHGQAPIYPLADFTGAWVLVGATAPGLLDLKPSPLAPVYAGVELHATLLDNLLQGDFLTPVPRWLTWLWTFALTLSVTVMVLFARRLVVILSALVLLVLLHIGATAALFMQGWLLAPVLPAAGLGLAFVLTAAFSYATEGRQKQAIRSMFSRYMSEDVINHLLRHPEKVRLGGERRRLTVFFSDLANFTTLSESLPPEMVVNLLNDYLSEMTDIILQEQGTVDKFEGDAIMAFWGAPLPLDNHAVRACRAALRQQEALAKLNQRFQEKGWPLLQCRIGLHTGEAVVGNLGSQKRFDYTIIGDTVNLASRLEGLNKFYGTEILVSYSTAQECQGVIEFLELDWVVVKGRATLLAVFQPLGRHGELMSARMNARMAFAAGLRYYRRGEFDLAWQSFQEALQHWPDHGPSSVFSQRCRDLLAQGLPDGWDAVFRPDKK